MIKDKIVLVHSLFTPCFFVANVQGIFFSFWHMTLKYSKEYSFTLQNTDAQKLEWHSSGANTDLEYHPHKKHHNPGHIQDGRETHGWIPLSADIYMT